MTEHVHRWSCKGCTTSFIMYTDSDPEACPNCGRTAYKEGVEIFYKIKELEIEVK